MTPRPEVSRSWNDTLTNSILRNGKWSARSLEVIVWKVERGKTYPLTTTTITHFAAECFAAIRVPVASTVYAVLLNALDPAVRYPEQRTEVEALHHRHKIHQTDKRHQQIHFYFYSSHFWRIFKFKLQTQNSNPNWS